MPWLLPAGLSFNDFRSHISDSQLHSIFSLLILYSHVFCIECANQSQLSTSLRENRRTTCPACDMHLPNPDDVVVTNLNPSEDYKTSVLSGLNPSVIMECAGRALSFWAYQTTQEMFVPEV